MIHPPGIRKSYISWWSSSQPSWSMCALVPTCLNTHGFRPPKKKQKRCKKSTAREWYVKISWINTFRRGQNWPPKIFHPRGGATLGEKGFESNFCTSWTRVSSFVDGRGATLGVETAALLQLRSVLNTFEAYFWMDSDVYCTYIYYVYVHLYIPTIHENQIAPAPK